MGVPGLTSNIAIAAIVPNGLSQAKSAGVVPPAQLPRHRLLIVTAQFLGNGTEHVALCLVANRVTFRPAQRGRDFSRTVSLFEATEA
jgi:hypothetical protein